jgi:serine/threonine protein phosphatase 1
MLGRWLTGLRRRPSTPPRRWTTPPATRLYAVGDVHGRADLLKRCHAMIADDMAGFLAASSEHRVEVVHLGDYIDRGPASHQVLDLIDRPWPEQVRVVNLKGNHEAAMLAFLEAPLSSTAALWLDFGGLAVLQAYGIGLDPTLKPMDRLVTARDDLASALPPRHLEILHSLRLSHQAGDYLFVHAGVHPDRFHPDRPPDDQDEATWLWIREPFLSYPDLLAKRVIHGHTITPEPDIRPHRIGIDLGAYATGRLATVVLEADDPPRFLITASS